MENLKEISRNYFASFVAKDLEGLEALFADNVSLRDWEIQAEGKVSVLAAL